ncbi:MAG TPA: helix-turn-helix domain-containing protein, partial [Acidimicrobiales bacterium]
MEKKVKGRQYDNTGRQTHSEETRQRVLSAARELMVGRGYRATTIAAVAGRAGVHVDTVYAL